MTKFMDTVYENIKLANDMIGLDFVIENTAYELLRVIQKGGTIYIAGNAGAGSNAEHFVSELVGRFYLNRKALTAVSLNSDTTTITCIGNDFGFEAIYERQLEALFDPTKDIFIGMSTSGNSVNINRAAEYLEEIGGDYRLLIGGDGGHAKKIFDNNNLVIIPSNNTPRIQEYHMFILHYLAQYIEEEMFGGN